MRPTDKATADSRSVLSFAITQPAQESLAAPCLGSTFPPLLEQWCGFFYIPQLIKNQISESAVRQDLRFFVLIRED